MTIGRHTEPHTVSEEMPHGAPRRVDRRLVIAGWIEPGAMRARDLAGEVGDGGDQRRPDLDRGVHVWPVIAARVKSQSADSV